MASIATQTRRVIIELTQPGSGHHLKSVISFFSEDGLLHVERCSIDDLNLSFKAWREPANRRLVAQSVAATIKNDFELAKLTKNLVIEEPMTRYLTDAEGRPTKLAKYIFQAQPGHLCPCCGRRIPLVQKRCLPKAPYV